MNKNSTSFHTVMILVILCCSHSAVPVQSLEQIDNYPRLVDTLVWEDKINATQQWQSKNIGYFYASPEYRHIIRISLDDNLTSVFGEESLYRISVNFSLLDYDLPPYKYKTFTMGHDSSDIFSVDFNATSAFDAFTKFSILSGNTRNSTVDIHFELQSYVIDDFFFLPNESDYSINTTSFPSQFTTKEGFLWNDAGKAFIFLPKSLFIQVQDYLIEIYIHVQITRGDPQGQVRVEVNEDEDTIDLKDEYILSYQITAQREIELQVLADTGNIEFEFSNITIYIPKILEERRFDFPELPAGGIIIGTLLFVGSTFQVYLYHSKRREIEEDEF